MLPHQKFQLDIWSLIDLDPRIPDRGLKWPPPPNIHYGALQRYMSEFGFAVGLGGVVGVQSLGKGLAVLEEVLNIGPGLG